MTEIDKDFTTFRPVPRTGVIYVMTEAQNAGYSLGDKEWINLGQGAPETGELSGAPARVTELKFTTDELEYAPVDGLLELREAVAELYNARYRANKSSKYTYENVAISSGGRLALTRLVSTIGRTNVGHFLPDYTAYEELLDAFNLFVPIPIQLTEEKNYTLAADELREKVLGLGLSTLIFSNPCNPTGSLVAGEQLESWVKVALETKTALIIDEFYSHYIFDKSSLSISAAKYVEDIEKDPVILLDGLTKNWRYPGFRVAWTVGPKKIIERVASGGSFLDGGCTRPVQQAAIELLKQDVADNEARAIKQCFKKKREILINGLEKLGIEIPFPPDGSFYCWGNLANLSEKINTGEKLFRAGLKEKLITVPGVFFDINPGGRRPDRPSRFNQYTRFSFGPNEAEIIKGLEKLEKIIKDQ